MLLLHHIKMFLSKIRIFMPAAMCFIVVSLSWTLVGTEHVLFYSLYYVTLAWFIYQYIREVGSRRNEMSIRRRTEDRIRHLVYYDDLTGLPNRRMFRERLAEKVEKAEEHTGLAVIYVDIDRFKLVIDSLGHDYGDILLLQVAERLTHVVGKDDFIARMERDEFALFFPHIDEESAVIELAQRIDQLIAPPFMLKNYHIHITVSIGISMRKCRNESAEDLMRRADIALSRAKEMGKNNYQIFTPAMNISTIERLTMENDMRQALNNNEFELYYQPQVDTESGNVICFEALLRWNHPTKGLIQPDKFIPLAEETGMIVWIGEWVIYEACRQNKAWQDEGYPSVPVSVNLSTRQFHQSDLSDKIKNILKETGLEAKYLELEITESVMMDFDRAVESFQKMQHLGVAISIDDFGTGYSSLSYLKKMPINKLKIDRSFVRDVLHNMNDAAIVATIISMARNLKLRVIAEGVETLEQMKYLCRNHCDELQGYFFSPPLPAEQISKQWHAVQEVAVSKVKT